MLFGVKFWNKKRNFFHKLINEHMFPKNNQCRFEGLQRIQIMKWKVQFLDLHSKCSLFKAALIQHLLGTP